MINWGCCEIQGVYCWVYLTDMAITWSLQRSVLTQHLSSPQQGLVRVPYELLKVTHLLVFPNQNYLMLHIYLFPNQNYSKLHISLFQNQDQFITTTFQM